MLEILVEKNENELKLFQLMASFRQFRPVFHPKRGACESTDYHPFPVGDHQGRLEANRVKILDEFSVSSLQQQGCFGSYSMKELTVSKRENKTIVSFAGPAIPNPADCSTVNLKPVEGDLLDVYDVEIGAQALDNDKEFVLFLEEAFFLAYGVGCLSVETDYRRKLKLIEFWSYCCSNDVNFFRLYVVYHFYRSKGWVTKIGSNYGVDYVLYRTHPNLYHSTFGIIVVDDDFENGADRLNNWRKIATICRILKNVKKELLLCKVKCREDKTALDFSTPDVLKNFSVEEIFVGQWFCSKHFSDT